MKIGVVLVLAVALVLLLSACARGEGSTPVPAPLPATPAPAAVPSASAETVTFSSMEGPITAPSPESEARQIEIRCGEMVVTYLLQDCAAADALWEQLPLEVSVEDYSTNEKIFYPPQPLDTSDAPLATGGAGVLAYYAPWGDVVLFYDDFSENDALFALGQVVSGAEFLSELSGSVQISAA